MKRIIAVAGLLALAGCVSPSRVVVLQQPETKQTVECRVNPWGSISNANQINKCVNAYKQAGYSVVGDSE